MGKLRIQEAPAPKRIRLREMQIGDVGRLLTGPCAGDLVLCVHNPMVYHSTTTLVNLSACRYMHITGSDRDGEWAVEPVDAQVVVS